MINDHVICACGIPRCELRVQHQVKFNLELFSMSLYESEDLPPSPKDAGIESASSRAQSSGSGSDSARKYTAWCCNLQEHVSEQKRPKLVSVHSMQLKNVSSVLSTKNKTKTKMRPSLQLDGTLSSILIIMLAAGNIPCHEFEPPGSVLETAKKQPCYTIGHTVINKN